MTTNLLPGMKIRVAVPLTVGDNTPMDKRKEFRISTIQDITDSGIIHESEGSVDVARMGVDWELLEGEDSAVTLAVVRLASGPILASVITVKGQNVELYSEQMVPPGPLSVPAMACGKCWDWLKGRTVGQAFTTLPEIFDPATRSSAPTAAAPSGPAPAPEKTDKKRGPKPRQPAATAQTAVLPAEPGKTVSASDPPDDPMTCPRIFTFKERARLWHAACELQKAAESEEPQRFTGALPDAIRRMDETLSEVLKGKADV